MSIHVSEIDCKDQFNNIKPSNIKNHFSEASQWLTKCKRWRFEETTWSVHKECKRPDRADRGNSTKFWYITHEGLIEIVEWEMSINTYAISAGKLWTRQDCIPMGGSFSAQSTDLHNLGLVYTHRHLFRRLGTLKIAEQGFIYWENARGKVSLQQFRDNILIASTYPNYRETALVYTVRGILQQAWGLRVLCDCCTSDSDACRFKCHNMYTQAWASAWCGVATEEGPPTPTRAPLTLHGA